MRNLCAAAAIVAVICSAAPAAQAAPVPICGGWQADTVASGLQQLENLAPDGHRGFYVSGESRLYHIDEAGQVRTVLDDLPVPRGVQVDGTDLYLATGRDGAVSRYDIPTGRLTTLATMTVPNGLLRLPDGDILTTWVGTDIGVPDTGVSRYHRDTATVQPNWSPVPRSEGLALSPDHQFVYTDDLFTGQIIRIPLAAPDQWTVAATVSGGLPGLDDLTVSRSGDLYAAAHLTGLIYRVDPNTGAMCTIDTGLPAGWDGPSSVRIAPDGDHWALYVSGFDGTLRRLRPPADTDLKPVLVPN
ncbi:SMP-30/gluconolactonase/LRE family protein [Nocardia sp. BSTN01]|nr:SMP-30/gluconolactonase/LRE family protein [Nocardia sp. BSTN01]